MSAPQYPRALGSMLILLVLALAIGAVSYITWDAKQRSEKQLADIVPRHARLLGLLVTQSQLDNAIEKVQALRAQWIYPATQDAAQAGNAAQQKVRDILASAGLQVLSSQVLPAKEDKGLDRIALTLRTEGDAVALLGALAALRSQTPVVVVSEMEVQSQSTQPNMAPRLAVQLTLTVLRARS